MRLTSEYHIPTTTRWIAGGLASVVTLVCAGMAAMSAMERSISLAGAVMFVALALVMVVGSHLLPALARGSRIGQGVFAVCVLVTLYNHAYFFDSEKRHMGQQRQAEVPPSPEVLRYEQELSLIAARGLPLVSADLANAQVTVAKATAALERCQAKEGARCTSAAAALDIAQAKVGALQDERAQALRAEDLRSSLSTAVAAHSAKVAKAGVNAVDASIARLLGIDADTVATITSVMQSIALEVMGALLWAVALPKVVKKPKAQEVRIKHLVPYRPQAQRTVQQIGWVQKVLAHSQARSRDSPTLA
ncbi:MAG: hypothetical protein PHX60_13590 [Giesbergeria sp.]|uniref:hypothetical protein n=1 Tax=Giesbergeria sp. TaxID=2818473 RepID=UPI002639A4D4|nr:hypothetical protein [Giesbergeria sp.]MDD2610693.1 hypothetical protein [Giesbergeria sp.]